MLMGLQSCSSKLAYWKFQSLLQSQLELNPGADKRIWKPVLSQPSRYLHTPMANMKLRVQYLIHISLLDCYFHYFKVMPCGITGKSLYHTSVGLNTQYNCNYRGVHKLIYCVRTPIHRANTWKPKPKVLMDTHLYPCNTVNTIVNDDRRTLTSSTASSTCTTTTISGTRH